MIQSDSSRPFQNPIDSRIATLRVAFFFIYNCQKVIFKFFYYGNQTCYRATLRVAFKILLIQAMRRFSSPLLFIKVLTVFSSSTYYFYTIKLILFLLVCICILYKGLSFICFLRNSIKIYSINNN